MIRPSLLAVARGDETPDLILANARLVNIFNGEVEPGSASRFTPIALRVFGTGIARVPIQSI